MKSFSTVKLQNKKSFWRVFYEQYKDTIETICVIGLPSVLGLINTKIKIIDTNNGILNFFIGCLIFYLFIFGLLFGIYLLHQLLWNIINFVFKIKAMNRYRQMPLTEDEFKLLDIKNINEFIELIDSYISYDFKVFSFFYIFNTDYKEYIINYEDIKEMIKTYNKLKTISIDDMIEIQEYFMSLDLKISNDKLREENFDFLCDIDRFIKKIEM